MVFELMQHLGTSCLYNVQQNQAHCQFELGIFKSIISLVCLITDILIVYVGPVRLLNMLKMNMLSTMTLMLNQNCQSIVICQNNSRGSG